MHKEGAAPPLGDELLRDAGLDRRCSTACRSEVLVEQFVFTRFESRRVRCRDTTGLKFSTSIIDYVFRALGGRRYLHRDDLAHVTPEAAGEQTPSENMGAEPGNGLMASPATVARSAQRAPASQIGAERAEARQSLGAG